MKQGKTEEIRLLKFVTGGQTIGQLASGKKVFVWGGLAGELVLIRITKSKSSFAEAVVETVIEASPDRVAPHDPESYLSTSPWQNMSFDLEQQTKADIIREAFELHKVNLSKDLGIFSDDQEYSYRNKLEFSWFGQDSEGEETLDLAFYRRGSKGKIIVDSCGIAKPELVDAASFFRDILRKNNVTARQLKTLIVRCDQKGDTVGQLYVKDDDFPWQNFVDGLEASDRLAGFEIIYSDPRSPASVITKRLVKSGVCELKDTVLGIEFSYAAESFFQINLPVYEQALIDIKNNMNDNNLPILDLYSGVGSIGLTVAGQNNQLTLVEENESAVKEMEHNIDRLSRGKTTQAIHSSTEKAIDFITDNHLIIVDPPRAGLHRDVIDKLLDVKPQKIIYLSCNPVTQARDIALLSSTYFVVKNHAYNFFPRTPHIEHLAILEKSTKSLGR